MTSGELLTERGQTHGSFRMNAYYAQQIRDLFRASDGWREMPLEHREALDNIALKLSRILSGQSNFHGHWEDVRGYAQLAEDACRR